MVAYNDINNAISFKFFKWRSNIFIMWHNLRYSPSFPLFSFFDTDYSLHILANYGIFISTEIKMIHFMVQIRLYRFIDAYVITW
jgi:hypothetical protein